ncbi:MAG: DNA gyrase inhibitor YacG [Pseudomonadota bacterium]
MKVKCPGCGKETILEENRFRPFCSERCKLIDFGRWVNNSYVISGEPLNEERNDQKEKDT